ncbi:MAG: nucleotide exchange factor GrpE [Alphaproteobacteria bacterium]|nr:nucleotide exchange factor GrpE [Alphaproteobacteria bacterium]
MNETPEKNDDAPQTDPAMSAGEAEAVIAKLEAEVADLKDRLLRALAEADNTRKRAERDRADTQAYGIAKFARDLLTVADNFRRGIESVPAELRDNGPEPLKNLMVGLEATERELLAVLERHGVQVVAAEGAKFDPNLHQAIAEVPSADVAAGHVVTVAQTGFTIGERLLRPAMVVVSKGGGANGSAGGGQPQGEPGASIDTTA